MSVGDPFVEITALFEMRDFLDTHLAGCRYGDSKNSKLEREDTGEEEIQMDDIAATRAPGSKRAGDMPAGVEQAGPDQRSCRVGPRTRQTPKRRGGDAR